MAQKKEYPGGFRLTRKKAEMLAAQELGTAWRLEPERGMPEGWFVLCFGNLEAQIRPDPTGRIRLTIRMGASVSRIVQFFDRETLVQDFEEEDRYTRLVQREILENWATAKDAEACHREIDRIRNGGGCGQ